MTCLDLDCQVLISHGDAFSLSGLRFFCWICIKNLPTLKLTAKALGWKTRLSFWGKPGLFSGAFTCLSVLGKNFNPSWNRVDFSGHLDQHLDSWTLLSQCFPNSSESPWHSKSDGISDVFGRQERHVAVDFC